MSVFETVSTLFFSAIFLISGTAKLCDLRGTAQGLRDFGVAIPGLTAAVLLSMAELAVGLALLASYSEIYGALGASCLTIAFTVGIAWNLLRDNHPSCNCFGPLAITHIGWASLVRSVVLTALAGGLVMADWSKPSLGLDLRLAIIYDGPVSLTRIVMIEAAAMVSLATILAVFATWLRRERLTIRELESMIGPRGVPGKRGLAIGGPAPDFTLQDLSGRTWDLAGFLAAGKPILLMFLSPHCPPCRSLAGDVAQWQFEHGRFITMVTISEDALVENERVFGKLNIGHLLLQPERETRDAYGCPATPGAVAIGLDGLTTSPMTMGAHAIHELWLKLVRKAQSESVHSSGTGLILDTQPAVSSEESQGTLA